MSKKIHQKGYWRYFLWGLGFGSHYLINLGIAFLWMLYDNDFNQLNELTQVSLVVFLFVNVLISALTTSLNIYRKFFAGIDILLHTLFGIKKPNWSENELFAGTMAQVRYCKMQKEYDKALYMLDAFMEKHAHHPEALFLKAEVLWEGFNQGKEAKKCLARVINMVPDKAHYLNRWSKSLNQKINNRHS